MTVHQWLNYYKGDSPDHWLQYECAHCNSRVSGAVIAEYPPSLTKWLFCPVCHQGSVLTPTGISPSRMFGPVIEGLPPDVAGAYNEVRRNMSTGSYVSSELMCRKMLMHVAVDKGAKAGERFASYLDYLEKQGYITPPIKGWADIIRQNGNEATHELTPISKERAEGTVMFTAELLKLIYEMEHLKNRYSSGNQSKNS